MAGVRYREGDRAAILAAFEAYGATRAPRQTLITSMDRASAEERIEAVATSVRNGVYLPEVISNLVESALQPRDVTTRDARIEYFLILHSQKRWNVVLDFAASLGPRSLGELPEYIADLCFLSAFRLQKDTVFEGSDKDLFLVGIEAQLRALEQAWPNARTRHQAYRAIVDHVTGQIDSARTILARSRPEIPFIGPLRAIESILDSRGTPKPRAVNDVHLSRASSVALVSLDEDYFRTFGQLFLERFKDHNPHNGVHFHCVGFDPAAALAAWNIDGGVGYTIDLTDLATLSPSDRRGYYAMARYLFLPRYLESYEHIFIADVDGLIGRDLRTILEDHPQSDVVMHTQVLDRSRSLVRASWEAISAGSLHVSSTPAGRRFAQLTSDYLATCFERTRATGSALWYADQNALFYSWYDLQDEAEFARFVSPVFRQGGGWALFQGREERLDLMSQRRQRTRP